MDLRYAIRSMRNTPGFTLLAVLVIALGIGANTAVFSVVNTVLLKPLAYRDPDRIVTIRNFWKKSGAPSENVSAPDFHDWHDQSTMFDAMAYYAGWEQPVLLGTAESRAEYAMATEVSPGFFGVMGITPIVGRLFNADEMKPKSSGAAVISAAFWQSHFAGNPNVLGQTLRLGQDSLPIVGVLPPGFDFPQKTAIWFPAATVDPEVNSRSGHNYRALGRLKPGVTVEQAQSQMSGIASRLEQLYPPSNTGKGILIERMQDTMVHNVKLTLYVLFGAVGVVLLIACANMANLLLAKATKRTREIAIRAAVGASRTRIVRQLIVESVVLAVIAGGVGLILAIWGAEAIKRLAPTDVPRLADTGIDASVLIFTFAVSVISSLIFGMAPALAASRVDLNESLKQGAAKSVIGGAAGKLRATLVIAEIALSVVLLTGAGLLMRSFNALLDVDLGFRPEKILVAETSVPYSTRDDAQRRAVPFDHDMVQTIAAISGVASASAVWDLPGDTRSNGSYWIDKLPPIETLSVTAPQAVYSVVMPGAFQTLGIAVKSGRDFDDRDIDSAPNTIIINEALARKSFPGQDPLGHVMFCGFDRWPPKPMTIIGVTADVHEEGPDKPALPQMIMPYAQHPMPAANLHLLARTSADPLALQELVRRKIHERDPEVPVNFTTMEASLSEGVAAPRFRMVLLGLFAALAVGLAMAGVYGVMSYAVGQRASEFGLRMALGADSQDVLRLVLGQGLMLAAAGLAIGLTGAVAASRLLTSLLFGVQSTDPVTYLAVTAIIAIVALAACYVPAYRATRVDPLVALRQE